MGTVFWDTLYAILLLMSNSLVSIIVIDKVNTKMSKLETLKCILDDFPNKFSLHLKLERTNILYVTFL